MRITNDTCFEMMKGRCYEQGNLLKIVGRPLQLGPSAKIEKKEWQYGQ